MSLLWVPGLGGMEMDWYVGQLGLGTSSMSHFSAPANLSILISVSGDRAVPSSTLYTPLLSL